MEDLADHNRVRIRRRHALIKARATAARRTRRDLYFLAVSAPAVALLLLAAVVIAKAVTE